MHSLIQELRFTLRLMWARRGPTFLGIAALALGVGLNTALYSAIHAVLLTPLPWSDPDKLLMLQTLTQSGQSAGVSYPDYLDWRNQAHSFSSMAAVFSDGFNLTGMGIPEHLFGRRVSASYFKVLNVRPSLGRDFTEDDDRTGAAPTIIISDSLWQRKFGKSPNVIGQAIALDNNRYTIIGVASPVLAILKSDFWIPISVFPIPTLYERKWRNYAVVGRLAPGVSQATAQSEMKTIGGRLAAQYPDADRWFTAGVLGITDLWVGAARKPLLLLFGAAIIVLLLACVNTAMIFMSGMVQRRSELTMRLALGASRIVLLRQILVQSIVFGVAASLLGLVIAKASLVLLLASSPRTVARLDETRIDASVLWFVAALAFALSLLLGVLPAFYALRLKVLGAVREGSAAISNSRRAAVFQRSLVVVQVSLAVCFSLTCALLAKSLFHATSVDLGFEPHRIISFRVALPEKRYGEPETIVRYFDRLIERIKQVPGVSAASAASVLPLSGRHSYILLHTEDNSIATLGAKPFVENIYVAPDYFSTLQIPLQQGRDFTETDRIDTRPVAIIDDVLARNLWPHQSALGKRIRLAVEGDTKPPWLEIIGVVKQVKQYGPEQDVPRMQTYVPEWQSPWRYMSLAVAAAEDGAVKAAILKKAYELDQDTPLYEYFRLDDLYSQAFGSRRLSLGLVVAFAALSLLLGAIGIYGIVASSVELGRREHAIRLALGSTFSQAILVLGRPIWLCAATGLLIGAAAILMLNRMLSSFLFGVTPHDPLTYLVTLVMIVLLVLLASLVPAQQLRRLNPQDILRE